MLKRQKTSEMPIQATDQVRADCQYQDGASAGVNRRSSCWQM